MAAVAGGVGLVILTAAWLVLPSAPVTAVAAGPEITPVSAVREVSYPAKLFDNGKARHFEYRSGDGVTIRYFVMKSSDGVIRAAFDACDVCWREDKGYVQKDDTMLCRNCGRRFPSARINEVSGGCNPSPLPRKLAGGKVTIAVADILQGRKYFGGKS